jgi:hypothetical protein
MSGPVDYEAKYRRLQALLGVMAPALQEYAELMEHTATRMTGITSSCQTTAIVLKSMAREIEKARHE